MTVFHEAAEQDKIPVMHKLGVTDFALPALAAASAPGASAEGSTTFDHLRNLTVDNVKAFVENWAKEGFSTGKHRCDILPTANERQEQYTGEMLEKYRDYAEREKSRLGLLDTEIREIDEYAYKKVAQKTWRDVLTVYTCRTCLHSLHMEDTLHRMIRRGDFADLLQDELLIVKVDVVLTKTMPMNPITSLPAMKYTSARYKDFPNWFQGSPYSPDDIFQFVRAYHSMRHVEIPGEGPSPFSKKPEKKDDESALDEDLAAAADAMTDEEIQELEDLARSTAGFRHNEL